MTRAADAGASATDDLSRLESTFRDLKTAYEKYFAGLERVEPLKERDELKRLLNRLNTDSLKGNNNTARRFRLQTFQASLITHEQHWNRIARQIEEGTFKRDRLRAERLLQQGAGADEQQPSAAATQSATTTAPAKPTAGNPGSAAPATNRPARVATTALPPPLRELYDAFNDTRKQLGEIDPVPVEVFAATLQKQYHAIKSRFGCQNVEFKVAVKDGRAILKAVPR